MREGQTEVQSFTQNQVLLFNIQHDSIMIIINRNNSDLNHDEDVELIQVANV